MGVCQKKVATYLENGPKKGEAGFQTQNENRAFDLASDGQLLVVSKHQAGVVRLYLSSIVQAQWRMDHREESGTWTGDQLNIYGSSNV